MNSETQRDELHNSSRSASRLGSSILIVWLLLPVLLALLALVEECLTAFGGTRITVAFRILAFVVDNIQALTGLGAAKHDIEGVIAVGIIGVSLYVVPLIFLLVKYMPRRPKE
jgi:uncharacterized membrane protein